LNTNMLIIVEIGFKEPTQLNILVSIGLVFNIFHAKMSEGNQFFAVDDSNSKYELIGKIFLSCNSH
jgi:hypothetical protein